MSKTARYTMFALLYFVQGAVMSYFTALNAIYLLSFDLSMTRVGIIGAIALIPFVLKIFLGMLSDRVNLFGLGHRKPYIVIGLLVQALCLFLAPLVNPAEQYWLFALLAFVLMSGQALFDTCTDGLALDTTPPEEGGTIQGFMVGGRALGVVVLSALIGWVAQAASWRIMFWLLALVTLIPLVLVLRVADAPKPAERKFQWAAFKSFARRAVVSLALLGAVYSLVTNAANQIINPFLKAEFGITTAAAGVFTSIWGIGVVLGGLSGGRLIDRAGHRRAVLLAVILAFISVLALSGIFSPLVAYPLVIVFGLAYGYYETVYFALAMRHSDARIAASMFSILMAVANIGTGIGLALSGSLVDGIGYRWTFAAFAAISLLVLLLLPVIFTAQPRPLSEITEKA